MCCFYQKLRKDKIEGADAATKVHYSVGKEVRSAIEKIGGTMPEDLPVPEKSIQQIEKEQMKRLKDKAKKGKLMLDEWCLLGEDHSYCSITIDTVLILKISKTIKNRYKNT